MFDVQPLAHSVDQLKHLILDTHRPDLTAQLAMGMSRTALVLDQESGCLPQGDTEDRIDIC